MDIIDNVELLKFSLFIAWLSDPDSVYGDPKKYALFLQLNRSFGYKEMIDEIIVNGLPDSDIHNLEQYGIIVSDCFRRS